MIFYASSDESFFQEKYDAESPSEAASCYALDYGVEPGDHVWVAWHPVPNNHYDPQQLCDEDNPEFYLAKSAGPFTVLDDDGVVREA